MIKNLNKQKEQLKEKLSKQVDDYFKILESSSDEEDFDINKFEQLMLKNQMDLRTILNEVHSELVSNVDISVKKNVQSAETP